MPVQVFMPSLGESVVEGTITRWLKKEGEPIQENEPLLEVNTDKVDTEIPSPTSGVILQILVPEETTVQAGALLAWIGQPGEAPSEEGGDGKAPTEAPQAIAESPTAPVGAAPVAVKPGRKSEELGFISPVVAKIASEHQVDLGLVPGTGAGGRITKKDVLAFLEERQKAPTDRPMAASGTAPTMPAEVPPAAPKLPPAPAPAAKEPAIKPVPAEVTQGDEILPLSTLRKAIAEHMVMSERTSPHVTTIMEADLSRVVAHRAANKDSFARDGANLTFTPYFITAIVAALKTHPLVNSSWSEAGIVLHRAINVGMAASLGEDGLIVPVIKNADSLSLLGLAKVVNDLTQRARARKLQPDEVKGGTFTLTNHGTSGSLFATPIINQPQCGILGVGAIQKRVMVVSGPDGADSIAIRPMVYVSLTFDHRILDGAMADGFLAKVVQSLQNWGKES